VEGKTLESHRKIKLFSKASGDGALRELPGEAMFPIYSENDPASHIAFMVYWVGTAKGWEQFVISQGGRPACLGRFKLGSSK
jgi:hypothetical protein